MKWGILATGNIAKKFASTINQMSNENEQLAAVGSRHMDSAKAFAREYDIPRYYDSYEALVNDPDILLADEPTGALDSKSAKLLLERLKHLNEDLMTTILMVTHDSFTASYAGRILFIKDGKVFHELRRGGDTRKEFFNKIIDVVTLLGGDLNDAL